MHVTALQFLMTGRDGKFTVSRRDGTVISNGRILSAGRDGNFTMSRRDGTVISNGRYFIGGTERQVTTVRESFGGTGRRDHFDGVFTVPSRQ